MINIDNLKLVSKQSLRGKIQLAGVIIVKIYVWPNGIPGVTTAKPSQIQWTFLNRPTHIRTRGTPVINP